jgi:GNAT superfamily N-acetyltransferase
MNCVRPVDPELGKALALHREEWFAIHDGAPGVELHRDPDVTWKLDEGPVWSNAVTLPRFKAQSVKRRLDAILARYAKHGRGTAFWIDADATPGDLGERLKEHRFRCQKHFPGMACSLTDALPMIETPDGITFATVTDYSIFQKHPHPVYGPITTPIRKHQLNLLKYLTTKYPKTVFDFVALLDGRPVGGGALHLGKWAAGVHDIGVLESVRGKGIGSALMAHILRFAKLHRGKHAVLLSSGKGEAMYRRVGFREVCRIAHWYRA